MLHSYPNVYQLGHKLVSNVLDGYVLVYNVKLVERCFIRASTIGRLWHFRNKEE